MFYSPCHRQTPLVGFAVRLEAAESGRRTAGPDPRPPHGLPKVCQISGPNPSSAVLSCPPRTQRKDCENYGAPGKNRTCDLRFRKTQVSGAGGGTASSSGPESASDSASTSGQAEPNGLGHQGDLGVDTKPEDERSSLKAALADLVASLNTRLGPNGYLLSVNVLEGELDLSDLDFPTDAHGALEAAPKRDVSANEAASRVTLDTAPDAQGVERKEPPGRRAPFRRRKRQASAGPGPVTGQGGDE